MKSRKNQKETQDERTSRGLRRHPAETEYNEDAAAADRRTGADDSSDPYLNSEASRKSLVRAVDRQVYDDGTLLTDEVINPEAGELTDSELGFTLVDTNSNRVLGNALDPELSPDSLTLGTAPGQVIESMDEYTEDQEILDDFAERQQMSTDASNLLQRFQENTHVSPDVTGDDVDADWERAQQVGEEAVGGTVPTPDQDIVEELGEAAGITYRDDEPLHTGDKLGERDAHRWELDARSAVARLDELDEEDFAELEDLEDADEPGARIWDRAAIDDDDVIADDDLLDDRLTGEDLEDEDELGEIDLHSEGDNEEDDELDVAGDNEGFVLGKLEEDEEDLYDDEFLDEDDEDILDDDELTDLTFLN